MPTPLRVTTWSSLMNLSDAPRPRSVRSRTRPAHGRSPREGTTDPSGLMDPLNHTEPRRPAGRPAHGPGRSGGRSRLGLVRSEAVAHARLGEEVRRAGGVGLELAAQ